MPAVPRQLQALTELLTQENKEITPEKKPDIYVKWLYEILNVIDSKSAHVLRLTALILAAQSFLSARLLDPASSPKYLDQALGSAKQPVVAALLLVPLFSSALALLVFRIKWPFLGRIRPGRPRWTNTQERIHDEIVSLAEVCDERVSRHKFAWCCTLAALVAFFLILIMSVSDYLVSFRH